MQKKLKWLIILKCIINDTIINKTAVIEIASTPLKLQTTTISYLNIIAPDKQPVMVTNHPAPTSNSMATTRGKANGNDTTRSFLMTTRTQIERDLTNFMVVVEAAEQLTMYLCCLE